MKKPLKPNPYAFFQKKLESYLGCKIESEVLFAQPRKFRFDFAILENKIAIEIEGGIYTNGRHTRGAGFAKDMEKYNLAIENGWVVLRYTPQQLNSLDTFNQIKKVYEKRA